MQTNFWKKTISFIKAEKRLFLALVFLVVTFFINRTLYSGQKITAEKCSEGRCLSLLPEDPQLSKKKTAYYVDDVLKNQPSGFYRLTFWEKSDRAEKIILKLNTYTEKEEKISELFFNPSDKFQAQEVFFFLPDGFDSLLFQKENFGSDADIFVKEVGLTKLNIDSESDLSKMQKTIIGEGAKFDVVRASQSKTEYAFAWLRESKTVLGQVFRATDERITGVVFDINVNKNLDPGSRQYTLSLRKVNYDPSSVSFSSPTISDLAFSVQGIEKYRQADGTFLFPLFGILEKGEYYAITLDNSKVGVSDQNYLEFRGRRDSGSYPDGAAIVRKFKEFYPLDGDLFFRVYGADFSKEAGIKILAGSKIEDLGKGVGKYSYQTKGKFSDLLDLESASPGTEFNNDVKAIIAPTKDEASFSYAVDTLYPIKRMNFSATQLKASWKKAKVSYSYDQKNWVELAYSQTAQNLIGNDTDQSGQELGDDLADVNPDNAKENLSNDDSNDVNDSGEQTAQKMLQVFDADIVPPKETRLVYFKLTYDPSDENESLNFGLKNLKITADLIMQ